MVTKEVLQQWYAKIHEEGTATRNRLQELAIAISQALKGDTVAGDLVSFQSRVFKWVRICFGTNKAKSKRERAKRFLEEALELAQACDLSIEDVNMLTTYVYSRPTGEIEQEVAGVRITLAALSESMGIVEDAVAETELARVWTKVDAIRERNLTKP